MTTYIVDLNDVQDGGLLVVSPRHTMEDGHLDLSPEPVREMAAGERVTVYSGDEAMTWQATVVKGLGNDRYAVRPDWASGITVARLCACGDHCGRPAVHTESDRVATLSIKCGNCGEGVSANIVAAPGQGNVENAGTTARNNTLRWLQCPSCLDGSVRTLSGAVWPTAPAGGSVPNLPEDTAQAWREARTSFAVAAYTASEMMCRKILMHVAVEKETAKPGGTFVGYIDALDKAGYIPTGLKTAVEKVKDRGNAANHELPASTEEDSLVTLKITEHLLRGIYEIPGL